jgi:formamidopyrimidine-DNA glycosylase
MPELPEVETIKRELQPLLTGKTITNCRVLRPDIIGYPSVKLFKRRIKNAVITGVRRRAKYLIIDLDSGSMLIFHLRLSGALLIKEKLSRHARIAFRLNDGSLLVFDEPRVLGRVYLIGRDDKPRILKGFRELSHEPISPEFDFAYFKQNLKKRKTRIKSVLLDQKVCAGVGNIYSDEALFKAGIRPFRRASSLRTAEVFKLLLALKDVLHLGIKHLGTTVSDYKRVNEQTGNFQKLLCVYSREGEPCKVCGTPIVVKKIGNRGTRYCPKCQK